jgi:pimeloyl-ACP methyl ester carboxylesterase
VLCHRFRGTMDDWHPALIDALAAERHVILFNNAGMGLSSGDIPATIKGMADRAAQFITAGSLAGQYLVAKATTPILPQQVKR